MSLYRTLAATVIALALSAPVFADDAANAQQGSQSVQPADSSMQQSSNDQSSQPAADSKININKASVKELMKAGLKPNQAKAIVAYRKKNGGFKSLDDLASIKPFKKMSDTKLKAMEDKLTVN